ncbi:hypothetical protein FBEOM_13058 [Fusarium beomiforme]|uniref:Uncharacterized protein n=1 Tax=Fusarium beomiforme TaxID=44412 RepID=A0A9P5A6C8_9HYPO|nr:hypothetical protein FBEOM_13058 [Fusarium beomiforme]
MADTDLTTFINTSYNLIPPSPFTIKKKTNAYELRLATCKDHGQGQPRHWVLMLAKEGATYAIFHHVIGGPMYGKSYEVVIKPKLINSHGIEKHHLIAKISRQGQTQYQGCCVANPSSLLSAMGCECSG